MQFEAGSDALVACGLAVIRHRGGHLERAVELLLGTDGVVGDRVIAGGGKSGADCCTRRQNVELDRPFVAENLRRRRTRSGWLNRQRYIVRTRGWLAECFRDRIGVLKSYREPSAKRNRLFEGRTELALFVVRIDARVHAADI